MIIATDAIVLKRIPYSDTSLICRLFTKEKGKVTVIAKGVQRAKKSTVALLEPINHIHVQYYHKNSREVQLLKDVGFIQHYLNMRKNLNRIVLALAAVQMIDKSTLDNCPYPILYRLGWKVLDKLNDEHQNEWKIFIFFLYQLSLRLGFMPNLSHCSKCNIAISEGGIDKYTGELVCSTCITCTENSIRNLSSLNKLISVHLDELHTLSFEKKEILDSIHFMDIYLSYHVNGLKQVKSMDMVRSILNKEKER